MTMHVAELWRYPVKSMAGERLRLATLTPSGIAGDRVVQVYKDKAKLVTARTHPKLLGHRATLAPRGEPLVDGRPWTDPSVLADVRLIAGPTARLERDDTDDRFDVLPLLVATDGAIAAFGRDGRRLRPNIVIGGVDSPTKLAEREWPGAELHIGNVVIGLHSLRGRCVMTTFDPDTQEQNPAVLEDIIARFGGRLALNAFVVRGGTIFVGQDVELARPSHPDARGISRPESRIVG